MEKTKATLVVCPACERRFVLLDLPHPEVVICPYCGTKEGEEVDDFLFQDCKVKVKTQPPPSSQSF